MPDVPMAMSGVRASRAQVFAAADQALKAGRRPTQEGIRSALGGGSLTSINTHLKEWYADLGARLTRAEQPVGGVPPEANELLQQLWWLALKGRSTGSVSGGESEDVRIMRMQRDAAMAQSSALQTLNSELTRQRASAERALVDTRALLMRREAALEEERAARLQLEQEVATLRLQVQYAAARRSVASTMRRAVVVGRASRVRKKAQISGVRGPGKRKTPKPKSKGGLAPRKVDARSGRSVRPGKRTGGGAKRRGGRTSRVRRG